MKDEIILALDVAGAKTGYAIYKSGAIIKSGTWQLNKLKKHLDLRRRVEATVNDYEIDFIMLEDIYFDKRFPRTFVKLAELHGCVEYVAEKYDLETYYVSALDAKDRMIGYEAAKRMCRKELKAAMIKAVTKLGYVLEKPNADDEADAIGLLITYLKAFKHPLTHPAQ